MRAILLSALVIVASACHSSSLPGDGDGGTADLAVNGDGGVVCKALCTMGFTCCDGQCVNLRNDIHHCGVCGVSCTAPNDYCDGQKCAPPPCSRADRRPLARPDVHGADRHGHLSARMSALPLIAC
jgi:hypothetical protein